MNSNGNAKENEYYYDDNEARSYALRGKIMLISILILFIVVIFMLCLHVYVRWRLSRPRRPPRRNSIPSRRPHFVFHFEPSVTAPSRGLDASVIATLPFFAFSLKTHPDPVDCPVCLSEFEEGETGRVLPKCNHTFHTGCIDMWFKSHSTCPLCRAPVEPPTRPEPGSSSGSCSQKPSSIVDVSIEVPGRNGGFEDGSGRDSPSSTRSSMSRVLSLKRILSRERKASVSASSGCAVGCSSTAELDDVERGGREETR